MKAELFEKLEQLKHDYWEMSFAEKAKFVTDLKSRLPVEALSDTTGPDFTDEVLLAAGMTAAAVETKDEFERALGLYGTGYKSKLREAILSGKLNRSNSEWRKELRRLFHALKGHTLTEPMNLAAI